MDQITTTLTAPGERAVRTEVPTDRAGNPVCRTCGVARYMHRWVNNDCHTIA